MQDGRECRQCGVWKPRTAFYEDKRVKSGMRSKCKDCCNRNTKRYREENLEKSLERGAAWRDRNREAIRDRQRRWHQENRDRVKDLRRKWTDKNRDHLREYRSRRYRENPKYRDKAYRDAQARRAKRRALPSEGIDKWTLFERDQWICGICDERIPLVVLWPHPESASVDHIIPLSHPECPGDVWSNVQASHLRCNLKKNNKI